MWQMKQTKFPLTWQFLMILVWLAVALAAAQVHVAPSETVAGDMHELRDSVRDMFDHAYGSYLEYGFPRDELTPLSCSGKDTWGNYSLTLIDTIDTLAVLGKWDEFGRVIDLVAATVRFNKDLNVSVFETNIRVLGGLLSAHVMAVSMYSTDSIYYDPELASSTGSSAVDWKYSGALLPMAVDLANRLLPAFDTPTGIPYGTVNLIHGVCPNETTVTGLATAGTLLLEFGVLSRLTGDPLYEDLARGAMRAAWARRSSLGLIGNHIDVVTGAWMFKEAGIGSNMDSFYEYLLKAYMLFGDEEYLTMFIEVYEAIETHARFNDWYLDVGMDNGKPVLAWFTALSAFWPGLQTLYGHTGRATRTVVNFIEVWRKYGFVPEIYELQTNNIHAGFESFYLRPELAESLYYLYQATRDPFYIQIGRDIVTSLQISAWVSKLALYLCIIYLPLLSRHRVGML